VFLDAGVPDSVAAAFRSGGHYIILHRDVLAEKTADDVVAAAALANDAVLVAVDPDMKQFPKRFGISHGSPRFAELSIIRICCNETLAAKRLAHAMSFIEHEWMVSEEKAARRLWVEIGPHWLRTNR
jgi:predicted nuclease of predicted toxin-antitoxin system